MPGSSNLQATCSPYLNDYLLLSFAAAPRARHREVDHPPRVLPLLRHDLHRFQRDGAAAERRLGRRGARAVGLRLGRRAVAVFGRQPLRAAALRTPRSLLRAPHPLARRRRWRRRRRLRLRRPHRAARRCSRRNEHRDTIACAAGTHDRSCDRPPGRRGVGVAPAGDLADGADDPEEHGRRLLALHLERRGAVADGQRRPRVLTLHRHPRLGGGAAGGDRPGRRQLRRRRLRRRRGVHRRLVLERRRLLHGPRAAHADARQARRAHRRDAGGRLHHQGRLLGRDDRLQRPELLRQRAAAARVLFAVRPRRHLLARQRVEHRVDGARAATLRRAAAPPPSAAPLPSRPAPRRDTLPPARARPRSTSRSG